MLIRLGMTRQMKAAVAERHLGDAQRACEITLVEDVYLLGPDLPGGLRLGGSRPECSAGAWRRVRQPHRAGQEVAPSVAGASYTAQGPASWSRW